MITFNELIKKIQSNDCSSEEANNFLIDIKLQGLNQIQKFAEALTHNQSLTYLSLYRNKLGLGGAKAIAEALKKNKNLTQIDLDETDLGPEGSNAIAEALKYNKNLTNINLGDNNLGYGAKAIAEALIHNQKLTDIGLYCNRMELEDVKLIAKALKHNNSLTNISLANNNLGPKGAMEIAEALKHNRNLTNIDIGENNIGSEGAKAIEQALKHNQILMNIEFGNGLILEEMNIINEINLILKQNSLIKPKMRLAFLSAFDPQYNQSFLSKLPKPANNPISLSRHFVNMVFVYAGCNAKPYVKQMKQINDEKDNEISGQKLKETVEKKENHEIGVVLDKERGSNDTLLVQFNQQLAAMSQSLDSLISNDIDDENYNNYVAEQERAFKTYKK